MRYLLHSIFLIGFITMGFGFQPTTDHQAIARELIMPIKEPTLFLLYFFPILVFTNLLFVRSDQRTFEEKCTQLIQAVQSYSLLAGMICFMVFWVDMRLTPSTQGVIYTLPALILGFIFSIGIKAVSVTYRQLKKA